MRVPWPKRRPLVQLALVILLSALAIGGLGFWFGPRGMLVGLIVCPLAVAGRYDNDLGTCFPLALLFMIILAVMALLLYLMLLTH